VPEIFAGFKDKPCSFAILIENRLKVVKKARASEDPAADSKAAEHLGLVAHPNLLSSMRVRKTPAKSLPIHGKQPCRPP
jgi:hypothetical protein